MRNPQRFFKLEQKIVKTRKTNSHSQAGQKGASRVSSCLVCFFIEQPLVFAGLIASAILLTLMQAPHNLSFAAWAAWVPFILACKPDAKLTRLLPAAYLVGLIYWFTNFYWLYLVTWPGYIVFSVIFGIYWPMLAFAVRFTRQKGWPMFLAAPVIFVGAEAMQGYLFTGFHWYFLAHSQYANLNLIQICDIFGTLGVSFVLAAVNGLAAQIILSFRVHKIKCLSNAAGTVAVISVIAFSLAYGNFRLQEAARFTTEGPLVGSVQPNVPSNVKEEIENGPKILNELIADSQKCVEAGAKIVAWPETMVLAPMNQDFLSFLEPHAAALQYQRQILEHSKQTGAYILFGAHGADVGLRNGDYDIVSQYNSAYMYLPDGTAYPKRYDKIHLVPFGEYIPFKKTLPWIYNAILWLSPYDYDYNLTAGTEHTLFNAGVNGRSYNMGVLICYEDTDPTVTRRHVLGQDGKKRADWLLNLSNDGWYVKYKDKKVLPTVELAQRTAISVFRSIENRISIIRSVNTGISCLIEPTGRIRDGYKAGNLPKNAMERQGVAGWFVDNVPIDSRVTFFSRHGRLLDIVVGTGFAIILVCAGFGAIRKEKGK